MALTDSQITKVAKRTNWPLVTFADGTQGIALDSVAARDFARAIESEVLQEEAAKLSNYLNETEHKEPFKMREVLQAQNVKGITAFNPLNVASNIPSCSAQNAIRAPQVQEPICKCSMRIAELEAEREFDQRNAAMSQREAAKLLDKVAGYQKDQESLILEQAAKNALIEQCRGALMTCVKYADQFFDADAVANALAAIAAYKKAAE